MTKEVTESDVKALVNAGVQAFTRVFDCLYLHISTANKASWHFRFQIRGKQFID